MQMLIESLKKLDVNNDNHWTADGLPRLDTVRMLASDAALTREKLDSAAPGFTRSTAATWEAPSAAPTKSTQSQAHAAAGNAQAAAQTVQASQAAVTATVTEQPKEDEAEQGSEVDAYEAAMKALAEAEANTADKRQAKEKADREFVEAQEAEDAARKKADALRPVETQGSVIQEYLAAQQRDMEAKAALAAKLAEQGVDLKGLSASVSPSALDIALSNKRK